MTVDNIHFLQKDNLRLRTKYFVNNLFTFMSEGNFGIWDRTVTTRKACSPVKHIF